MATKITENLFDYGQKYFRGNAHLLKLATFGEKKDPIGAKAYVDPQGTVKPKYLVGRVSKGEVAAIDWGQTTKADVEVNGTVKVFGVGLNSARTFSYEQIKSAKLKLCNLSMVEGQLKSMLNTDADNARKYMANEGNDARIVSEVWVVMEAELAEHFDASASVSASASADGNELNIIAKGGRQGTQTITLSAGTTFAYKLHKVKDWNRDKTQIEDMEADYKGMS